jgi:hypothetical protein
MRDYQLISPSLDGILHHESIVYEGINRPFELLRIMDRSVSVKKRIPSTSSKVIYSEQENKILLQYFHDLNSLFMKSFSQFMIETGSKPDDSVKLLAMLQELIKIKDLLGQQSNS